MITVYRDYGKLGGGSAPNNVFTITPQRQVYMATHEGENSLPFMKRSFISFTFGGKKIEDFNLIATTQSNSLNRSGYAPFNDITSTYDALDGQQYWNTHYSANSIDFVLATDGMEQRLLDDFLYWFRAGSTRELILAEHPNRGILARVASAPQLDLLPFEEPVDFYVNEVPYNTSTTLYKGTISLSLIMDSPHWYSLTNILGRKSGNRYVDEWRDANGTLVNIFTSKDALKILYEDGIPLGSIIQKNMLLGNGGYANVENNISSCIWDETYTGEAVPNRDNLSGGGACINGIVSGVSYVGIIAGAIIDATGNGITSLPKHNDSDGDQVNVGLFYYSGTAPAPTEIRFTMTPSFNSNGYITSPFNTYAKDSNHSNVPYTSLIVESTQIQELRFTTPNLFTSYNEAINIFNTYMVNNSTKTWEDIRTMIRERVRHIRVREWANKVINDLNSDISASIKSTIRTNMRKMLQNNNNEDYPVTFTFNSDTGAAVGQFHYHLVTNDNENVREENVGDMLRSNYIIIRDRNYPTNNNMIEGWTSENPQWSHRIYHTSDQPLSNLSIIFRNMYL